MKNVAKTKERLSKEVVALRQRIAELGKVEEECKRAKEALQSEKDELLALKEVLAKTEIGIDIVGIDYKVLFQNEALRRKFGDLTGKLCYEGYMGLKEPCDSCAMIKAIGSKKLEKVELTGADGRDYEVFAAQFVNPDRTVDKVIEVAIDITERKRAEEALQTSEQEKSSILNAISDVVVFQDRSLSLLWVNNAGAQTIGKRPQELVGQHCYKLWHGRSEPCEKCPVLKALEIESRAAGTMTTPDGRQWEIIGEPVRNNVGEIIGAIEVARDITERKQSEENIKRAAEEWRTTFDSVTDLIFINDKDFRLIRVNKACAGLFKMKLKELIGKPCYEIVHGTNGPVLNCPHMKTLETKRPARGEFFEPRLGIHLEVSASPIFDEKGEVVACVHVARDVTERKLAVEALRESEEKYSTLVERGNDGIVIIQDGLIRFANSKMVEIAGLRLEEVLDKPFVDFISLEYEELLVKMYEERISGQGVPNRYESVILSKDGRRIDIEVNASRIEFRGRPADMAIIREITERKRMQEQLIITDRLASIGELAAGVAHELNNPLTSVIGFAQLILEKDIPDDVKEDVRIISSEAQRTAEVVKKLLTFARKHAPVKQLVNVNSIIEKVLELRAYEEKVSNIQVNTRFAPDLPEVMADYFQLQQVFLNIIINTEHFMIEAHHGGTLTITTEKVDDIIKASFADDGPGISKENLGHLFDPFFTTKEVGKGTGLGLSICHGIITEHGGRIYAESELDRGATFTVELPISDHG